MSEQRNLAEDLFYRGLELFEQGEKENAVQQYQAALVADPNYADAMHGLARAYQDLNRYDEAIEISKQLVALDPNDVLPHTSLSILYQKKGMIPEAEAEANQARILGWKQQLKRKQ